MSLDRGRFEDVYTRLNQGSRIEYTAAAVCILVLLAAHCDAVKKVLADDELVENSTQDPFVESSNTVSVAVDKQGAE